VKRVLNYLLHASNAKARAAMRARPATRARY